jgi:hypothetical protein
MATDRAAEERRGAARSDGGNGKDPTPNVLDLVAIHSKRQDDLRVAGLKELKGYVKGGLKHVKEIRKLMAKHQNDLSIEITKRLDAESKAEKIRVDAAFEASKSDVALALQKTDTQASTLASTQAASVVQTNTQFTEMRESNDKRFKALEDKMSSTGGSSEGRQLQRTENTASIRWIITTGLVILGMLAGMFMNSQLGH